LTAELFSKELLFNFKKQYFCSYAQSKYKTPPKFALFLRKFELSIVVFESNKEMQEEFLTFEQLSTSKFEK